MVSRKGHLINEQGQEAAERNKQKDSCDREWFLKLNLRGALTRPRSAELEREMSEAHEPNQ